MAKVELKAPVVQEIAAKMTQSFVKDSVKPV